MGATSAFHWNKAAVKSTVQRIADKGLGQLINDSVVALDKRVFVDRCSTVQ